MIEQLLPKKKRFGQNKLTNATFSEENAVYSKEGVEKNIKTMRKQIKEGVQTLRQEGAENI